MFFTLPIKLLNLVIIYITTVLETYLIWGKKSSVVLYSNMGKKGSTSGALHRARVEN